MKAIVLGFLRHYTLYWLGGRPHSKRKVKEVVSGEDKTTYQMPAKCLLPITHSALPLSCEGKLLSFRS